MQQREREKIMRKDVQKNYVLVLYISLHGIVQKPEKISFYNEKILKAANNSFRIPDLPTGYVNNINLIANEL